MKDNMNQQASDIFQAILEGQTLMYTKCEMCGNPVIKFSDYTVEEINNNKKAIFKLICINPECKATAECTELWTIK